MFNKLGGAWRLHIIRDNLERHDHDSEYSFVANSLSRRRSIAGDAHLCSSTLEELLVVDDGLLYFILLQHRVGVVEHVSDARNSIVVLSVALGLLRTRQYKG